EDEVPDPLLLELRDHGQERDQQDVQLAAREREPARQPAREPDQAAADVEAQRRRRQLPRVLVAGGEELAAVVERQLRVLRPRHPHQRGHLVEAIAHVAPLEPAHAGTPLAASTRRMSPTLPMTMMSSRPRLTPNSRSSAAMSRTLAIESHSGRV